MNAVNTVKNYNNNDTDRLDSIMLYLHENYQKRITLSEVAKLTNMSDASLMRFLKKWTGKTFIDNLNEIRVAEAVCRLTDTSDSISEICYRCGFNNLSEYPYRVQGKIFPFEVYNLKHDLKHVYIDLCQVLMI